MSGENEEERGGRRQLEQQQQLSGFSSQTDTKQREGRIFFSFSLLLEISDRFFTAK